jgi:hypothetical protein
LVYFEAFDDVHKTIGREKQLKGWRREKKIALIESRNPRWEDPGSADGVRWRGDYKPAGREHGLRFPLGLLAGMGSFDCVSASPRSAQDDRVFVAVWS